MSKVLNYYGVLKCFDPSCKKDNGSLLKCAGCRIPEPALYCSKACQLNHWPLHKQHCTRGNGNSKISTCWEDSYRRCEDGSNHMGKLELVTWDFEDLGWGGTEKEETAELREKFEVEMNGSKKKLLKYYDSAFRWTCCGQSVSEGVGGCDHHGDLNNPMPCACDFCRSGRPLPDRIFNKKTTHKVGLTLRRGPDPRSLSNAGILNYMLGKSLGFIEDD